MRGRMIYLTMVEYRFKKGKAMSVGKTEVVTCETSAMDIQKYDTKCLNYAKAEIFGIKSKAFTENNFWFTKILSQKEISRSFALMEEYNEEKGVWIPIRK